MTEAVWTNGSHDSSNYYKAAWRNPYAHQTNPSWSAKIAAAAGRKGRSQLRLVHRGLGCRYADRAAKSPLLAKTEGGQETRLFDYGTDGLAGNSRQTGRANPAVTNTREAGAAAFDRRLGIQTEEGFEQDSHNLVRHKKLTQIVGSNVRSVTLTRLEDRQRTE